MSEQEQAGDGSSVIRFCCKSCGQKIRVPQSLAGKKSRCPKCKGIVIIPASQDFAGVENRDNPANLKISSNKSGLNPSLFDIPKTDTSNQSSAKNDVFDEGLQATAGYQIAGQEDKTEQTGERKFPWLIDIFLYPVNLPGLLFFGIVILIPLILDILMFLLGILAGLISLPCSIIIILIGMYVYWYFVQCIRDSGLGGIRAPETIGETPGFFELLPAVLRILVCLVVCAAPAAAYFAWSSRLDIFFWVFVGCGGFYYLMALLTVAMFDSIEGLNPLIVIPSIFSTFFQYCGLVLIVAAIVWALDKARETLAVIIPTMSAWASFPLVALLKCVELYLLMVAAHLLGRFYFRYQEKLDWEV